MKKLLKIKDQEIQQLTDTLNAYRRFVNYITDKHPNIAYEYNDL